MKVLKFGGTSVGAPKGRDNICSLALQGSEQSVVIVSALGGVTDMLLQLGHQAASSPKEHYEATLKKLYARHYEAIELSVPRDRAEEVEAQCTTLLDELSDIAKGISLTGEFSPFCEAKVVAYGERLSSIILASMIEDATHIDSTEIIKTTPYFGRHIVDFTSTNNSVKQRFAGITSKVVVMGGFISSEVGSGRITNLGRGGSDYTAAIVASALKVSHLYIYTDVDGFLSADPRIVSDAVLIDELGFVEAMELCNFGAKVVYPPTIFPAYNANIPIVIRNTYSNCAGTTIRSRASLSGDAAVFKGISSINDTALLTLRGLGALGLIGVNYRLFKALGRAGISIFLVSQQSSDNSTSVAIRNGDIGRATTVINEEFASEIAMGEIESCSVVENLAIVAVVGSSLSDNTEATAMIYSTLESAGINIITSGQGGAQNSVAFVTELASLRKATIVLHSAIFSTSYSELNISILGDSQLMEQVRELITKQRRAILERHGLRLNITDSTSEAGIIVDTTTTQSDYSQYTNSGKIVVSANRVATYNYLSSEESTSLLYGAAMGDSTQIIRTLRDLTSSGDRVLSIRAILSPELDSALRGVSSGSELLKICSEEELSGAASSQRLGIIAHSIGIKLSTIEIDDVISTCDELLRGLTDNQRLSQVCYIEGDGTARIAIEVIGGNDPLYYNVEHSTTTLINTLRYREYPLQIKGYEAPTPQSLSALILSDILSVAKI